MGGKNQTTTQNSSQTYTPAGASQLQDIWDRVQQAASTPYQPYTGQMVADLNPVQQSGIANINNAFGSAQPYFNEAADYARSGASAIDPNDVQRYMSPYTQQVIDATRANFGETNAQQQQQVVGNAAMQGALGGDRVGVAKAELARQQKLAQDPVIANLYASGYDKALGAAQQDRAAQAQGAYTMGALAPSVQNAQIQGGQAQIGAGSVAQGNQQAKLSADYNQYLQALAFPYQQAGFLASSGLPAVQAMGGTQAGTQTTTKPGPSPWGQIAGLGLAGASLFMPGASALGASSYMANPIGMGGYGGAPVGYDANGNFKQYRHGGRVDRTSGFLDTVHAIRQSLRRGGPVIDMHRGSDGIYVPQGFAGGGVIDGRFGDFDNGSGTSVDPLAFQDSYFAQNGADPAMFGDNAPTPLTNVPLPAPRPAGPMAAGLPPEITGAQGQPIELPPDALGFNGSRAPQGGLRVSPAGMGAPDTPMTSNVAPAPSGGLFGGISEDARMGLLAAGLGMMASQNTTPLGAIGEGGLAGVKTYTGQKQERAKLESDARRLAQQAEQFARGHDLHERQLGETSRYHAGMLERENQKFIGTNEDGYPVFRDSRTGKETIGETKLQGKAPSGYVKNADGTMSPIKGGPADPVVIKDIASAKQGKPLADDTADFLAERVIAGDSRALVGLGRGAQGAENISRVQSLVAQKARERGMDASDLLAKTAEQSGLTAAQRTFGTQVARMAVNATEAQGAIELGRTASANVPRTNWVPVNKAIQAYQSGSSDPMLAKFGAANLAIINTYARAISPTGQPTIHDKEEAQKLLSTATGPDAYNAILDQMNAEIQIAHDAPAKAKREMEAIRKGGKTEAPKAAELKKASAADLDAARAAIKKGAPKDSVIEYLRQKGFSAEGL